MDLNQILTLLICLFFSITFIESGGDKLFNQESNLSWLRGHFEKTFLRPFISSFFYFLLFFELILGIAYALGIIAAIAGHKEWIAYIQLAGLMLLILLFTGQRIAKDYVGASGIVPYIIVGILGLILSNHLFQ